MQENKAAQTTSEWVFVARSLAQLPDSQNQALGSMARAEMLAQGTSEWIAIAKAWTQNFNDSEKAQQCLAKATSHAESSADWEQIAELWVEMGDYSQAAKIYREYIEPMPWKYLTELQNIHGGNSDGTTVLDWVEPGMTARASSDSVSDAEGYFNDNKAMAVRLLVQAESFADCSNDWIRIANVWRREFQSSDSASWCMERAEKAVDDCDDWLRIARAWKYDFQDSDEAILCLMAAEDHAGGVDSWELILETWKDDFQDPENYLRCVEKCANDLEEPWSCIESALYDEFVYNHFIRDQSAIIDLGALTESIPARIGVWNSDCVSERQPGGYARYYTFTLAKPDEVAIFLESNDMNPTEPHLYLVAGNSPSGEVLAEDHGSLSIVRCNLPPGTYTVEAATEEATIEENVTEIFTLRIFVEK